MLIIISDILSVYGYFGNAIGETGNSPLFAAANRLYERSGFVRCAAFGGYCDTPFTHFYTREI